MAFDYTDTAFATPLIRAIVKNERQEVRKALSCGFSANLPDNRGWTPLHEAATDDARNECMKELLTHRSAIINTQTFLGESPLFIACQNDCIKITKLLLKHSKCSVNLANNEGVSPLHVACNKGNLQIVKCLVEFGANVNSQDFNGYTPLHEAVASGSGIRGGKDVISCNICQYLLNHGANPDLMEYEGNYPFHFACQNGLFMSVNLLFTASKQQDLINFKNNDGRSPLMMAVPSHNLAVVEALLSFGANANVADSVNVTALHLAAHTAHFEIFSLILKSTSKECILKYCTFDEERDFEKIVLCKRINSLICLAIDTENVEFLISVLESDLDPAALQCPVIHAENLVKKTFTLHTPVSFLLESKMYDLGERTLDFLETLIDHGCPLKVTSKNILINFINPICAGLVALNDCPIELVMKCLQLLLERGADPDEPYGRMSFSMEQACMRGCADAVLLLLQYSNVIDPENVLKWIEQETSSDQEKIIEALIPLAPYYNTHSTKLVSSQTKKLLELSPKVFSLASYCRSVIRKQLHEETKLNPTVFQQRLLDLLIPKSLYLFLRFM